MSRFSRPAARTTTINGSTSVGGTTDTVLSIQPDGAVRFVDRWGQTVTMPMNVNASAGMVPLDRNASAVFRLVDVLLARRGA